MTRKKPKRSKEYEICNLPKGMRRQGQTRKTKTTEKKRNGVYVAKKDEDLNDDVDYYCPEYARLPNPIAESRSTGSDQRRRFHTCVIVFLTQITSYMDIFMVNVSCP